MPPIPSRLAPRLALLLGALLASPIACSAQRVDSFDEEGGDSEEEGLTGDVPAGTALKTTTDLNLRSEPSTSSKVLDVLPAGSQVTAQASAPTNGFYQISYQGKLGWSSGKYLEPADGGVSGPAQQTLTAVADVNLRGGPSTSDTVLTVIPMDSVVKVVKPDPVNGFYNVTYKTFTGWSSGKFLTPDPSAGVPFANGTVWKFRAKTLAVDIAVFVPQAAEGAADVDVLFYSHGLNVCSPVAKNPPLSFVTDAPFYLAKLVDASQKPLVLVAPFFDWEHLSANNMSFGGTHHKLGIPQNLNGVMAEVMEQIGQHRSAGAPALSSLILAGHSRAYDFLNPLAAASADPQMSSGALAKLSQVYAFDTGYVCSPVSAWSSWLKSKPSLEISMFYRAGTSTEACGKQFASLVPSSGGRLSVKTAPEEHCAVPQTELPPLLDALP